MTSDDIEAQLAKYASGFGGSAPDTKARREREKKIAASPDDGRRKRSAASKRTKQLNLLVQPEMHRRMVEAAHERGVTMTALLEAAIEAYLKRSEGRHA